MLDEENNGVINVVVDINGNQSPNQICKDVEKFVINSNGEIIGSKKDGAENITGMCKQLDAIDGNTCSAQNPGKCKTAEEFETLWNSSPNLGWHAWVHGVKIDENKCLLLSNPEANNRMPCRIEEWVSGSGTVANNYCYMIITPSTTFSYNSTPVWSEYCD